ncbi:MAG: hypothetical protein JW806_07435 [Sedimentisphaerales bacterium]|nr:hypothetical protein [Sedimentisphaerales bacterium]
MDRIIFGDNQFFGVNHMSEEKARAQSMRFKDSQAIMKVLDIAYDAGIKTFMCTTHDRIAEICDIVRDNPDRYDGFKFYPCMPYAHKYANAVTEEGALGALKKFTSGSIFLTLIKGGKAVAQKDMITVMKLLIDAEMKMFEGLKTDVIFLQNVTVDLILGLGFGQVFAEYAGYIRERYHAEPGFITMNLPLLLDILEDNDVDNPIICSSINKIGFRMCGGIEKYEKDISERKFRAIAMSILASGAIAPEEAVSYVCGLKNVESIVFGASSKAHILQTKELIERFS